MEIRGLMMIFLMPWIIIIHAQLFTLTTILPASCLLMKYTWPTYYSSPSPGKSPAQQNGECVCTRVCVYVCVHIHVLYLPLCTDL